MALYFNGNKIIGSDGTCSADKVSLDDTNLAYAADDVQEAFEKVTKSLTYEEYEALTDAEKNNGTIYLITDVNGDGQSFQPVIYSTEEREIGVWTNGKPLYEKTWEFSAPILVSQTNWTDTTIPIADIDKIVSVENVTSGGSNVELYATKGTTYIQVLTGRNQYGTECSFLTLRYTKTTDQAGSGQWTPQGVPAVHYSTEEQVVGTWVDGKPLYEKTLKVGTTSSTSEQYFETNILSADVDTYFIKESFIITGTGLVWTTGGSNDSFLHILFLSNGTTNLRVSSRVSSNAMYGDLYVTIRYTKAST